MEGLFSKRFKKALAVNKIPYPSFKRNLRKRLAMICHDHSEVSFYNSPDTEVAAFMALKKAYGMETLRVQDEMTDQGKNATSFEDFLVFAYPQHVLDALEAFYRLLSDEYKHPFLVEINAVLTEENSSWRMSDERMYLVDSRFLEALKNQIEDEMKQAEFFGAHEEFNDALSNLLSGDIDDAIHKANCAFESALKSLLEQSEGAADDLLKYLRNKTDLLGAVSEKVQSAITSKVLLGLPVLRNKIGGHGQGPKPIDVPRAYGDLAINLAATYIKFLLDLKKELKPISNFEEHPDIDPDDVPF